MAKKKENEGPQEKQKLKRSAFDHFINFICILILIGLLYSEFSHLRKPEAPMAEYTYLYEKHYDYSLRPPFVIAWYLLRPKGYDPQYKYPLVLALHGISNFTYAGVFLANQEFRERYPVFVVVPIMSKRSSWATPEDRQYTLQRKGLKFPDALPRAVAIIGRLQKSYAIDPDRIYITGHSAGGIGTFGGLARYPDVFAAGLASAGLWAPLEAPALLERPVWAVHGARDTQIPADVTRELMRNISDLGGTARYNELPGAGHGIWRTVYENPAVWDWLLSQKMSR